MIEIRRAGGKALRPRKWKDLHPNLAAIGCSRKAPFEYCIMHSIIRNNQGTVKKICSHSQFST